MDKASENIVIDRGMALHKMIRLMTISTGGQAYLNFMGNEFGHPEWIDFPREGNGWSYAHARRQWSLAKNGFLRYSWLGDFDKAMIKLVKRYKVLADGYAWNLAMDECNKTMVFSHGNLLFVFNWHPTASIPDYELPVQAPGKYVPVLSTDEKRFGGQQRQAMDAEHFSFPARDGDNTERPHIRIYMRGQACCFILGQGRPSPAGKGRHPVSQPRLPAKRRAFGPRRSRPEAVCRPGKAGYGQGCNACRSQMAGLGRATALVGRKRRPPDGEKGSRTDKRYTSTATCRRDRTRPAGGALGR